MATRFVKLVEPAVDVGAMEPIPHGLGAVPDFYFCSNDCGPDITESTLPPDAVNVYLENDGVNPEPATVIAILQ